MLDRRGRRGRLALGMMLGASGLVALGLASGVSAAGNTIATTPAAPNPAVGGTFTVEVFANAAVALSGAQASMTFDPTRLRLTGVSKGPEWVSAGASFAGVPATTTALDSANAAGRIPAIATFFVDGSTNLSAAADHTIFSATFLVVACGTSALGLPVGPADAAMIDGTPATYGESLTVTSVAGSVAVSCQDGTPSPTSTPAPTPRPTPTSTPTPAPTPTPTPRLCTAENNCYFTTPEPVPSPTETPTPMQAPAPTPAPAVSPGGAVAGVTTSRADGGGGGTSGGGGGPSRIPPTSSALPALPHSSTDFWLLLIVAVLALGGAAALTVGNHETDRLAAGASSSDLPDERRPHADTGRLTPDNP